MPFPRVSVGNVSPRDPDESPVAEPAAARPSRGMVRDGGRRRLDDPADRLEEVADILAHDLGNHLTVATGNLELARERGDGEYLERVEAALNRIDALVREVVFLARTGELIDDTTDIDLGDAARRAWAAIPTADATLELPGSMTLEANRAALQHLLENVMQNAIAHSAGGVTVRVGVADGGFYIEDDGPGIPPADRDRVFESGFKTGETGSGLGLTIADRIAAAHGWTIRVTDSDEGGACFVVETDPSSGGTDSTG